MTISYTLKSDNPIERVAAFFRFFLAYLVFLLYLYAATVNKKMAYVFAYAIFCNFYPDYQRISMFSVTSFEVPFLTEAATLPFTSSFSSKVSKIKVA